MSEHRLPRIGESGAPLRVTAPSAVVLAVASAVRESCLSIATVASRTALSPATVRRALHPNGRATVERLTHIAWAAGFDLRISIVPRKEPFRATWVGPLHDRASTGRRYFENIQDEANLAVEVCIDGTWSCWMTTDYENEHAREERSASSADAEGRSASFADADKEACAALAAHGIEVRNTSLFNSEGSDG